MGDGAAERAVRGALEVDVDPLVVTGRLGEGVDALLLHDQPGARAQLGADGTFDLGQVNRERPGRAISIHSYYYAS